MNLFLAGLSHKRPLCSTVQFFSPKIRGAWGGSHDPNLKLANFKICRDASYILSNFFQWIFYYDFIFKNLFLEEKEGLKFHSSCEVWILPSQNNLLTNQNASYKKEQAAYWTKDSFLYIHRYQNTPFSNLLLIKEEFCHSLSLKSLN